MSKSNEGTPPKWKDSCDQLFKMERRRPPPKWKDRSEQSFKMKRKDFPKMERQFRAAIQKGTKAPPQNGKTAPSSHSKWNQGISPQNGKAVPSGHSKWNEGIPPKCTDSSGQPFKMDRRHPLQNGKTVLSSHSKCNGGISPQNGKDGSGTADRLTATIFVSVSDSNCVCASKG